MRLLLSGLILYVLVFATGCLGQECRTCEAFNFEAEEFNPDFSDRDIVLREVGTDRSVTFAYIRSVATPSGQVCGEDDDALSQVPCLSTAIASFRNADLGIDLNLGFEESEVFFAGGIDRAVMSFEFKSIGNNQFVRTHAVVIQPEIVLNEDFIVELDTITLGDSLFVEVIDLRQTEEAFGTLVNDLPEAGQFVNIYFGPGRGLLGLRDVNGTLYIRE